MIITRILRGRAQFWKLKSHSFSVQNLCNDLRGEYNENENNRTLRNQASHHACRNGFCEFTETGSRGFECRRDWHVEFRRLYSQPNERGDQRDKISYGQAFWGKYHPAISQCERECGGSS